MTIANTQHGTLCTLFIEFATTSGFFYVSFSNTAYVAVETRLVRQTKLSCPKWTKTLRRRSRGRTEGQKRRRAPFLRYTLSLHDQNRSARRSEHRYVHLRPERPSVGSTTIYITQCLWIWRSEIKNTYLYIILSAVKYLQSMTSSRQGPLRRISSTIFPCVCCYEKVHCFYSFWFMKRALLTLKCHALFWICRLSGTGSNSLPKGPRICENGYVGAHITWLGSYVFFDSPAKRRVPRIKLPPIRTQHIVKSEEEALPDDALSRRSFLDGFCAPLWIGSVWRDFVTRAGARCFDTSFPGASAFSK